jgi:hypothetical protein
MELFLRHNLSSHICFSARTGVEFTNLFTLAPTDFRTNYCAGADTELIAACFAALPTEQFLVFHHDRHTINSEVPFGRMATVLPEPSWNRDSRYDHLSTCCLVYSAIGK